MWDLHVTKTSRDFEVSTSLLVIYTVSIHVPWYCWRRAQGDNLEVYWCFWEWLSLPFGLPLLDRELWKKVSRMGRTPWRGEERSLASLGRVRISPAQCCCCRHRRRECYSRHLEATTEGREDIQVAGGRACNPFPFSLFNSCDPFDSSCKTHKVGSVPVKLNEGQVRYAVRSSLASRT